MFALTNKMERIFAWFYTLGVSRTPPAKNHRRRRRRRFFVHATTKGIKTITRIIKMRNKNIQYEIAAIQMQM